MPTPTCRLKLQHIIKTFPGVRAVQDVNLEVYSGEILSLVGENGAGKSTLMNVVNGIFPADSGNIYLDGELVTIDSPRRALELGITMIHQELALIPQMTVGQNIYLGREPRRRFHWLVDWKKLYSDAKREMDHLGIDIPVKAQISELSIAQRQMVEIAKALFYNARLIALDEPTSAITDKEAAVLFQLMRSLREKGVTLIYISHRLEEVFDLSDRIAVMRDGQLVSVANKDEITPAEVIRMMVGRELNDFFPKVEVTPGNLILEVHNLKSGKMLKDANLTLHTGEIVGIAGLVGAGRTNLARVLFGADPLESGKIFLDGKQVTFHSPQDAIRLGIGLVTEDRKNEGLFLGQSVRSNMAVGLLKSFSRLGFIHYAKVNEWAAKAVEAFKVRTPSLQQRVKNLSGGNQQKVIIARWLALNPKVLILDEPTRGVDVGAKAEIYALIGELAANGVAILMISSELPEILGISDRILVMREGQVMAEFSRAEATQDKIMQAATGQLAPAIIMQAAI